jgi:hypothetical protein
MKAISVTVPLLSSIGLSHKAAIKIDKLNKTDLSDKLKNIVYSRRNFSHEIVFGNTHTHTQISSQASTFVSENQTLVMHTTLLS